MEVNVNCSKFQVLYRRCLVFSLSRFFLRCAGRRLGSRISMADYGDPKVCLESVVIYEGFQLPPATLMVV